jgi:hypothetical protein
MSGKIPKSKFYQQFLALLISGMNFCVRGALRAPLTQKFIPLLSNAQLLNRLEEAIDADFFLEASWIAYAVIEDCICSTLLKTGGLHPDKTGKTLQMLGSKLEVLASTPYASSFI